MGTYVVGDIQGCYASLRRLLDRVRFDPARDRLWAVGDLVNRGPDSLATLRFFQQLGDRARVVLGNHDLHLIAMASGVQTPRTKDTLHAVLDAPDADTLVRWLRRQPLLHRDDDRRCVMVHAGIPPCWSLDRATALADEVGAVLRGDRYRDFLALMYGNVPEQWDDRLTGPERWRVITNYLTRMRFCNAEGRLELSHKGKPADAPPGFRPWYTFPNPGLGDYRLLFGHWAALMGRTGDPMRVGLDTGCVWGHHLTALRLEDERFFRAEAAPGDA